MAGKKPSRVCQPYYYKNACTNLGHPRKQAVLMRMTLFIFALLPCGGQTATNDLHFVTEEFPPFSYSRGNNAAGALPDVVNQVCRKLDYHCSIEVLSWRRALQLAEDGEVDGIFSVIQSPARHQAFLLRRCW
jgi:polar amino acid transport system substrate-binding protein